MLEWDHFRYVLAVHRHKTLSAAALSLKVNQSTVGRRISALDDQLKTQLLEKSSDGYVLSDAGQRILTALESVESTINDIQRGLAGSVERIEGVIRVAIPGALANHWLIPKLSAFQQQYPRVELDLLTGPEVVNLSRREADLAIRLVRPVQKELIVKRIGALRLAFYVDRSLMKKVGQVKVKQDLAQFPFITLFPEAMSDPERALLGKVRQFLRPSLRSGAWSSVYYSIKAGLGVGILPMFMGEEDSDLELIKVVEPVTIPIWGVLHPDLMENARVRKFLEFATLTFSGGRDV